MDESAEIKMSVAQHIGEMRKRILIVSIAVFVATGIALFFSKEIYTFLQRPLANSLLNESQFITLSPIEGWLVYFKIAIFAALIATSPLWMYELWAFISPGLYKSEKKKVVFMGFASAVLFTLGVMVCYFLILPYGFNYFVSILNQTNIKLMPQMSLYLSFIMRLLVAFGIVFEIPIVIIFLVRFRILSLEDLRKKRAYVILAAFVLAAVITPPDVFTQFALAIPFIVLFEISLLVASIVGHGAK